MKKSESIRLLQSLGLNTLDALITDNEKEATYHLNSVDPNSLMSIRTERNGMWLCPFYYGLKPCNLIKEVPKLISQGYTLLIYHYLDWKDSIAFGAIGLPKTGEIIVEYVEGPGLNRELDSHPKRKTKIIKPGQIRSIAGMLQGINDIIKEVYDKIYTNSIIEWSYYKYPVGVDHKHQVYWELRDYA